MSTNSSYSVLVILLVATSIAIVEGRPREVVTSSAPPPAGVAPSLLEPLFGKSEVESSKNLSRDDTTDDVAGAGAGPITFFRKLMRDGDTDADAISGSGSGKLGKPEAETPRTIPAAILAQHNTEEVCRPRPDPKNAQYIVGYGSLMQKESKSRTAPDTGPSIPVIIRGFRREWNTRGAPVGLSTTYLGVVKDDKEGGSSSKNVSTFNAVIFKLPVTVNNLHETLKNYDEREEFYCRQKVPNADVVSLLKGYGASKGPLGIEPNADFWIYVNRPDSTAPPSRKYPIVESYVDIFISGCLELENGHLLPNFTDFCISSTHGWSPEWVNDRIYPRRPFMYQPAATAIDKALAKNLPSIFDKITVEG